MRPADEGLLLVDKPRGPTSHDIVDVARQVLGERRIGHTGTLDPGATGLLALVVGRATRLARFVIASPKSYTGTIRLGVSTATDDAAGEVTARHAGAPPGPEAIAAAALALTGQRLQTPPAVSARKVGGQRLYLLARRGVTVVPAATEVVVERFDVSPPGDDGVVAFEAVVSAGTYIRSLARDLGAALECGASVLTLRRHAIGRLSVDVAVPFPAMGAPSPEVLRAALIPIAAMPLTVPDLTLAEHEDRRLFAAGRAVSVAQGATPPVLVAVRDPSGSVLGVGALEEEQVRPRVVLPPARVAPLGAV